jgi:transcriptional regulator with XRE-family HTH domain
MRYVWNFGSSTPDQMMKAAAADRRPISPVKRAVTHDLRTGHASEIRHAPKVEPMVRTPEKNFLRAWREYRRMTQAQLAEAVDTTGAVISLLEAGHRGLSDKWLRKLAPVLGTTPGHLLDVDPNDVSSDILEIWAGVPEESREQVLSIIKTFTGVQEFAPTPSYEAQKPKAARDRKGPKGI